MTVVTNHFITTMISYSSTAINLAHNNYGGKVAVLKPRGQRYAPYTIPLTGLTTEEVILSKPDTTCNPYLDSLNSLNSLNSLDRSPTSIITPISESAESTSTPSKTKYSNITPLSIQYRQAKSEVVASMLLQLWDSNIYDLDTIVRKQWFEVVHPLVKKGIPSELSVSDMMCYYKGSGV